ncbi:hypothetical protein AVEN_165009-1 [Araneus ventricosus]|uniref:Uncharacterized protein n=1 Tax=Araneus ventricosus TaxID=182803 RepID=A0A4Y2LWQ8_ARAVE|nr:hypothetical protein AVEN_165009-1 [Araneus ventricosus]
MRALDETAKNFPFILAPPLQFFVQALDSSLWSLEGSQNLFHEHQAIKFGGSFTDQTEQTAPTCNPILGDRVRVATIGAVRSTVPPPHPAFKTSPPCPNFPRMTATHTLRFPFRGFWSERLVFRNRLLYFSFMA